MKNILHIISLAAVFTAHPLIASPDVKTIEQLSACLLHQSGETITLQQNIDAHRTELLRELTDDQLRRDRYSLDQPHEKPISALQDLTQLGALIESIGISNRYRQRQLMHFKKNQGHVEQDTFWKKFISKLETDEKKNEAYLTVLKNHGIEFQLSPCSGSSNL